MLIPHQKVSGWLKDRTQWYEWYTDTFPHLNVGNDESIIVVPLSISGLTLLVGVATFTVGVVMLVRGKRVLYHSSQTPLPGTHHYEMVDEG